MAMHDHQTMPVVLITHEDMPFPLSPVTTTHTVTTRGSVCIYYMYVGTATPQGTGIHTNWCRHTTPSTSTPPWDTQCQNIQIWTLSTCMCMLSTDIDS